MGRSHPRLTLENIGPIRRADVCFSDLTVLAGPQATGKSLFLQFLKLVLDHGPITNTLRSHGLDWKAEASGFLNIYLGRGMSSVWSSKGNSKSWIQWQGRPVHLDAIVAEKLPGKDHEQCFVIPAQRVLAFSSQSWLRQFSDCRAGDPYVIRAFSEHLRIQAEAIFDTRKKIWGLDDAGMEVKAALEPLEPWSTLELTGVRSPARRALDSIRFTRKSFFAISKALRRLV